MLIDLHVHTWPRSPCSSLHPEEAIQAAKTKGLDGICLVEHDLLWDMDKIEQLKEDHGFLVLRGMEVNTNYGHFIAFGLETYEEEFFYLENLVGRVEELGGVVVAVHPFRDPHYIRGNYGTIRPSLTPADASRRHLFNFLTVLEVCNGQSTPRENWLSTEVSRLLSLVALGGSDAHSAAEVGQCITIFQNLIRGEKDLIREIKAGRLKALGPDWQSRCKQEQR